MQCISFKPSCSSFALALLLLAHIYYCNSSTMHKQNQPNLVFLLERATGPMAMRATVRWLANMTGNC